MTTLFRGLRADGKGWVEGYYVHYENPVGFPNLKGKHAIVSNDEEVSQAREVIPETVGQYTGFDDTSRRKIFNGDLISFKRPYRTTQTHTGDNIPNGSYTEPMEPGIETMTGEVVFENGAFWLKGDSSESDYVPLVWVLPNYDLESIEWAIEHPRRTDDWFYDPDEGDLQYLISEVAKVETVEQLIEYLNKVEIIGNVHEKEEWL